MKLDLTDASPLLPGGLVVEQINAAESGVLYGVWLRDTVTDHYYVAEHDQLDKAIRIAVSVYQRRQGCQANG